MHPSPVIAVRPPRSSPRLVEFLLFATIAATLTACDGPLSVAPSTIRVQPTFLDFGNVTPGQKLSQSLTISNTGRTSISIISLSISLDGGTPFSVGPAPAMLAAGSSASIQVLLDAPMARGAVNGDLTIASSATNAPELIVPLTAQVEPPCAFVTCGSDATCSDGTGAAVCTCNEGFKGDGMNCTPVNPCLMNNGGCDRRATCIDTGPATRSCECNPGYSGDGTTCMAINPCLTNNGGCDQNASCANPSPGVAACTCLMGYSGNGMTCTAINECLTNNGGCDSNATCASTGPGTDSCTCNQGYSGNGRMCTAINACLMSNGGCDPYATCASTGPGTDSCACNPGYSGNGRMCTAINACLMGNGGCDSNATCASTGPGTDSCTCNQGYTGNGQTCAPVNACLTSNGGCDSNATCASTGPGTDSCACNPGYTGNGQTCAPVNACLTSNGGCDRNATCTSTGPGTNTCTCNPGSSGNGGVCTSTANLCVDGSGNTVSGAWVTLPPMQTPRGYTCGVLVNDKFYVFGGASEASGGIQFPSPIAASEVFDLGTHVWSSIAPLPTATYAMGCAAIGESIYIVGGRTPGNSTQLLIYDTTANSWAYGPNMSYPRSWFEAGAVDGLLYAVGGVGYDYTPTTEIYNPSQRTWSVANGSLPTGRYGDNVSVVNRTMYVLGGDSWETGSDITFKDIDQFDAATQQWTTIGNLPMPTSGIVSATHPTAGLFLAFSGQLWQMALPSASLTSIASVPGSAGNGFSYPAITAVPEGILFAGGGASGPDTTDVQIYCL
jgi:hypothetical protein